MHCFSLRFATPSTGRFAGAFVGAFFGLSLVLATLPAQSSEWEKIKASDFQLPDPPDAKETAREVGELLKLQAERTTKECKLGSKERNPDFTSLFTGKAFLTSDDIKTLAPLMNRVSGVGEKISSVFKKKYRRVRPYDVDARLQPCVPLPGGQKSYPSSHAAISTLDACVLSFIFDDAAKEAELRDLAVELSERRMKVGVHFPSDVHAGQDLGMMICYALRGDAGFQKDVESIRRKL